MIQDLDCKKRVEVAADIVVVDMGTSPRRDLHDPLVGAGYAVHLAGDALSPGDLQRAIATGRRVAQAIP